MCKNIAIWHIFVKMANWTKKKYIIKNIVKKIF